MPLHRNAQPAYSRIAFTLIELLIVVGIVAVLAVVTVVVLNPAELLKQGRDSRRLAELASLNRALQIVEVEVTGASFGSANTVYVSLPDTSATCANLGLPTLPSGWSYGCAPTSTYQRVDGTGWLPVNFTAVSSKSPLSSLPIDPVNSSSTGQYYTYTPGGSWKLSARLESAKQASKAWEDGDGIDPLRYEIGSDLTLLSGGLALWLKADAISGLSDGNAVSAWLDSSGRHNDAAQSMASSKPTYKTSILNGKPVVRFDGNDALETALTLPNEPVTILLVAKAVNLVQGTMINHNGDTPYNELWFGTDNPSLVGFTVYKGNGSSYSPAFGTNASANTYYVAVLVVESGGAITIYRNGVADGTGTLNGKTNFTVAIGGNQYRPLNGDIAEVLLYNSVLSIAERQAVERYLNSKYAVY